MAKSAKSLAPVAAVSSDFEWADDLPVATRGGGFGASDTLKAIDALPAPRVQDGKTQFAVKFFPLTDSVPEGITDPAERASAEKDNLRKLVNKLSGITRRISKKDASKNYTTRAKDHNGVKGVAVYRINAEAPATANEPVAATAAQ